jgi:predicted transcriptional regulator
MKKSLLFITTFIFALNLMADTTVLPKVVLEGDKGGKLDGSLFDSSTIKDKVHVLFYVDPDEKDLNEETAELIKKEKFDLKMYGSIAIINMAATWLPNFAIESSLKAKQKKYPDTLYVKDFKKVLVKEWDLLDDSSNILVFNKAGAMIYKVKGKATKEDGDKIIQLIKENLK